MQSMAPSPSKSLRGSNNAEQGMSTSTTSVSSFNFLTSERAMKAPGAASATGRESDNPRLSRLMDQVFQQCAPPSSALTVSLSSDTSVLVVVALLTLMVV